MNRLSRFTRWRLTSGTWLYSVITAGWLCIGGSFAMGFYGVVASLNALLRSEPIAAWPFMVGFGLFGFGSFALVFEVGVVELLMSAQRGRPIRRIEGDHEMTKEALEWQRKRRKIEKDYAG